MKYRTSCDSCQDTKVRCSQSKPSCQRCTRKGLGCVYSPLRTVGRPRKRLESNAMGRGTFSDEGRFQPLTHSTGARRSGLAQNNGLPSPPAPSNRTSVSEYLSDTPEHIVSSRRGAAAVAAASSPGESLSLDHGSGMIESLAAVLPGDSTGSGVVAPSGGGDGGVHQPAPYCPEDWLLNCHLYQDFPVITWPPENAYAEKLDIGNNPWTSNNTGTGTGAATAIAPADHDTYHGAEDARTTSEPHNRNQFTVTLDASNSSADCYVMLLGRLAQIEQFLASIPPGHPPPIDFTLGAESDLQKLKERIFTCQSHINAPDATTRTAAAAAVAAVPSSTSPPCLSSSRPVFLILCLLGERVVHLFEELFRRANVLAQPFTEPAPPPALVPCPDTRRLKRTMRSLLDYSSTCPFPEANKPLHLGRFGVSDEVKTRALRRILRGRMEGLLDMLDDMRRRSPGNIPSSHARGIDRSSSTIEALGKSVGELYLRVESLLGRLDLTG
ncbi:hypothetical protein B0H66DRAFT_42397 [Apodospora peruviana]|uniref:Zn(2)-C6 fungal-type domain-containing protein n=1 Tax=Apodospora peruviana TaxID=516989 RepID=A0AAE0IS09_9PEZI|nr:hypothetical protein B0H66DRAFT_42397 [Apodospora peruviana]